MHNYLGIQDAPWKCRGPSLEAGPWAGSTVLTSGVLLAKGQEPNPMDP